MKCSLLSKGSVETADIASLKLFLERVGVDNEKHLNRIGVVYPELLRLNSAESYLKEASSGRLSQAGVAQPGRAFQGNLGSVAS